MTRYERFALIQRKACRKPFFQFAEELLLAPDHPDAAGAQVSDRQNGHASRL
ncbi:MAG: hypothetical protein ABI343_13415 [Burkholderiaceae bacterium]